MPTFTQSIVVDAAVETVFAFHERPDALTLLTPPFPPVRMVSKSGGLEPGSQVELRVGFLPWVAMHTEYRPNRLFVDEQVKGPFAKWIHHHQFASLPGNQTRLTDQVDYLLPGGPIVNAALGWAVNFQLKRMFRYRHKVTRRFCERQPQAS